MDTILVVDGYNAINAIPRTQKEMKRGLSFARKAILAISKKYARSSGYITKVSVVFDGDDKYEDMNKLYPVHGASQVFSRTGEGDDKIIDTVKRYSRHSRVILASNDNYVRNNSRAYGAALISAEELACSRKSTPEHGKIVDKRINSALQDKITREYRKELGV